MPARKAPRIKWQSLQPVSAPPTIEILSSPTEGSFAMANADIEFEALQLSEWAPEELESEVISVSSDPSNDLPSRTRLMFDSPEVLGSLVTISTGNHHRSSLEA